MIVPVTYGISPHILNYIYIWWNMGYIWINPHFWMGLYGLWDELRVIYIYMISHGSDSWDAWRQGRLNPSKRAVKTLPWRWLASCPSSFAAPRSGRSGAIWVRRSFFRKFAWDFTCNWYYIFIYIYTHASVFLHVYAHIYLYIYIRMCVCYNIHIRI